MHDFEHICKYNANSQYLELGHLYNKKWLNIMQVWLIHKYLPVFFRLEPMNYICFSFSK